MRAEPDDQAAQLMQQDQQLGEILEEEMTHREQVSVLSHMHLKQMEEVKVQSQEIRRLLALVEQQQQAIEKLTSPQNLPRESRAFPESQLDDMREEIVNLIPGTANTIRGTAVSHNTTVASAPRISQTSFKDMLAEEANSTPGCQPKHVTFRDMMEGYYLIHTQKISRRGGPTIQTNRKKPSRGYWITCGYLQISKDAGA